MRNDAKDAVHRYEESSEDFLVQRRIRDNLDMLSADMEDDWEIWSGAVRTDEGKIEDERCWSDDFAEKDLCSGSSRRRTAARAR